MQRTKVTSSLLHDVGHDGKALEVTFKGKPNQPYRYPGVPAELHADMMNAASVGSFFLCEIKKPVDKDGQPLYPHVKADPEDQNETSA